MKKLIRFLNERLPLGSSLRSFLDQPQPPNVGWKHTLGSALLFLITIQVLTGGVLIAFFAPTPDHAWESLKYLADHNTMGNLVRGIHVWGSSFLIIVVTLHILRIVFTGSYKRPRELNWTIGLTSNSWFLIYWLSSSLGSKRILGNPGWHRNGIHSTHTRAFYGNFSARRC